MTSYGLKVNQHPNALEETIATTRLAEELGAELVSVADHPYVPDELDSLTLLTTLAAHTDRIHLNTNVATLPLRPPALLAEQGATLHHVSGGRFALGIGAASNAPIAAFGGPERTIGQSVAALDEAIGVLRRLWSPDAEPLDHDGEFYHLQGVRVEPTPQPSIPIWVGAFGPRMLRLTGRLGDGWLPTNYYLELDDVPAMQRRVDEGARSAGRDPASIRRVLNVFGLISPTASRRNDQFLIGPVDYWVDALRDYTDRLGFDTIVFWPTEQQYEQTRLFLQEVTPRVP